MLPLANVGGDPAQEYFADGITEALITELAKIRSLRVVSRTSVTRFRGTKEPVSADRPRPARASAAGGQLLGAPFSAEYWHIGETNIRLATVSPRIETGENRTLILSSHWRNVGETRGTRSKSKLIQALAAHNLVICAHCDGFHRTSNTL